MSSALVFETLLPVAGIVFGIGGVFALAFRSSLTVYHAPAVVLILLAITAGISAVNGGFSLGSEAEKTDYTLSECADPQATPNADSEEPEPTVVDDPNRLEFSSLSADGKDVFRATLQADGVYTTTTRPAEFIYQGDTGTALNYIQYEGECYALHADSRGGLGIAFAMLYLTIWGGLLTIASLVVGTVSLGFGRFKLPTSTLAGLAVMIGLLGAGVWLAPTIVVGASLGVIILSYLALRALEARSTVTFQERMDA